MKRPLTDVQIRRCLALVEDLARRSGATAGRDALILNLIRKIGADMAGGPA